MPRAMPRSRSRRAAAPRGFFGNPRLLCAYVYFEKEPDAESATKLMTRDESRRITANVAKLSKPQGGCRDLGHGRSPQRLSTFRWVRMNQGVTCVRREAVAASLSDRPHKRRCNLCPKGSRTLLFPLGWAKRQALSPRHPPAALRRSLSVRTQRTPGA